jgi:hypothetical protein
MSELLSQTQFMSFSNHLEEKEELFTNKRSEVFSMGNTQCSGSIGVRSVVNSFNSDDDKVLSRLSDFSEHWRSENITESKIFSEMNVMSKEESPLISRNLSVNKDITSLLTEGSSINAESLLLSDIMFVSSRKSVSEGDFDDKEVVIERFVSFVWIVCITILFVTGTFFFGWSIYSEMRLANVKEDTTSS